MKKFLIISGVVLFSLALIGFVIGYTASYSKGYRAGTITKMSRKGVMFKTYEGQLHTGGLGGANDSDLNSIVWDFSVEGKDQEVLTLIESAVDNGSRVKLFYEEKFFTFPWRGKTKYFITKVELVKEK